MIVASPDASNCDEINDLQHPCAELFSVTYTLIILDNCAISKDSKKRSNKFINLAFSGRHEGLSVWVLTPKEDPPPTNNEDISAKRKALAILATIGDTKGIPRCEYEFE